MCAWRARPRRCRLDGAFLVGGNDEANIVTAVDHAAPGGQTSELVKGVAAGSRPRRVSGLHRRARGRAEDRCEPAEPQPDHRPPRGHRHQARTRNLRRRRQMQPRRHGRRSRRGRAVLSARARHPARGGAAHADRGLSARGGRGDRGRRRARRICSAASAGISASWRNKSMAAAPLRSIEPATRGFAAAGLDVGRMRREFPIFDSNPGLVFLDSGASAQKPRQVIDGIAEFYRTEYANVHRGVYRLSAALDRPVRGGAREGAGPAQRRRRARDRVRARRHRGDQPRRAELGPGQPANPATRSSSAMSSTTRTSCRGSMLRDRLGAEAGRRADRRHRRIRPGAFRGAAVAAHPARRGDACLERDRRDVAGRAHRRAGACDTAPRC